MRRQVTNQTNRQTLERTMAELRWIQTSLIVKLLLQVPATHGIRVVIVREGDDVTFPCIDNPGDQGGCGPNSWAVMVLRSPEQLITGGNMGNYKDRLSVTESCDLVLQDVLVEDTGMYICGDNRSALFVITMTEQKDGDERKLTCSVSTLGKCYHSVRLLFEDKDVKDTTLVTTHESECSSSVTVPAAPVGNWTDPESLTCVVAGNKRYVQNFTFIPQASEKKTAKTFGPQSTAASPHSALTFIMLLMRVAELLLLTVIIVLLIRAAGNQGAPERSLAVRRSGAAAFQVHHEEDEDEDPVDYENSVRLH